MKCLFTHRQDCPQKKSPVINGAEGDFSTDLPGDFSLLCMKNLEALFLSTSQVNNSQAKKSRSRRSGSVAANACGLFSDAEAGEDASQQVIGAERPGDLSQRLLRLP